jgi:hypothetical protein
VQNNLGNQINLMRHMATEAEINEENGEEIEAMTDAQTLPEADDWLIELNNDRSFINI